jgi:hypothetical protein
MGYFRLAYGIVHIGGVLAATRQQGHDGNWRSPDCPREKFLEKDRSYNRGHGKRAEGKQDGGLARSSEEVW